MTLVLKENINPDAIFDDWLDGASGAMKREVNRVSLQQFPTTVSGWSSQNKPDFQTDHNRTTTGARSTITAVDQRKPLYPWVHITGTKPHIIRATKPHGLLVFPIGGRTVFTRRPINHPGFKSTGEVERIQREEYPKVEKAVEKAGANAVNKS